MAEAFVKVFDDDVGDVLEAHHGRVEAEVVACRVAPALVGVEIVEIGAEFVGLLAVGTALLECAPLRVALEDAAGAVVRVGVDKDVDQVGQVAQHIVGRAAHDYARLVGGNAVHEVALRLVQCVVVRAGGVVEPGYGAQTHVYREQAREKLRAPLVLLLEELGREAAVARRLHQQLAVIESDAEPVGQDAPQQPSAAAHLPPDSNDIFVRKIVAHNVQITSRDHTPVFPTNLLQKTETTTNSR